MGNHNHNLTEQFIFSGKLKTWSIIAIVVGVLAIGFGFISGQHERTYANLLLMAYYFTCVCAAGLFFITVQYVSQAGWATGLLRIPEAMSRVLPLASLILFVVCTAGLLSHNLYHHWNGEGLTDPASPNFDKIIAGKSSYLNVPFFITRLAIFLGTYSFFAYLFSKYAERQSNEGGLVLYDKNIKWSAVFLIIFGFTTPIWAFDTIMSLEAHWFSTMFGWYNFAAMWVSGLCVITLIVILLKKGGYLSWVNENHLHDLGKFIFAFSIFWAYIWFSQFLLIYYANMPEETVYFYKRLEPEYLPWFWVNIIINFAAPLLLLMARDSKRKTDIMLFVCIMLILGHWLDYYIMIMPGTVETNRTFGIVEIGTAIGFAGLFTFLTLSKLSSRSLAPTNHPFLEESLHHQI